MHYKCEGMTWPFECTTETLAQTNEGVVSDAIPTTGEEPLHLVGGIIQPYLSDPTTAEQ